MSLRVLTKTAWLSLTAAALVTCSGYRPGPDAGQGTDAGLADSGVIDSGLIDAGIDGGGAAVDAGMTDAGADAGCGSDGNGNLSLSPANTDFGSVAVGAVSSSATLTFVNAGCNPGGPLNVIFFGAGFVIMTGTDTCTGATLPPNGSCSFAVIFAPTGPGPVNGFVQMTGIPLTNVSANLTGLGTLGDGGPLDSGFDASGQLTITPASQNFLCSTGGTRSSPQGFTVTNTGGSPDTVLMDAISGANASDFVIYSDGCNAHTLQPSQSCSLAVTVQPSTTSGESANLTVTGSVGSPATAGVAESGQGGPPLFLSPCLHDFGSVSPHSSSAPFEFTVTNGEQGSTSPLNIVVIGSNPADFVVVDGGDRCTGVGLVPNTSCTFDVAFTPSAAGAESATVNVTGNPQGGQRISNLFGTGFAGDAGGLDGGPADGGGAD